MMINNMKVYKLTEDEMEKVAGGIQHTMRNLKWKQKEEARKQNDAAKQSSARAHGGISGRW